MVQMDGSIGSGGIAYGFWRMNIKYWSKTGK